MGIIFLETTMSNKFFYNQILFILTSYKIWEKDVGVCNIWVCHNGFYWGNQVFRDVMLCHSEEETLTLWRNIEHSSYRVKQFSWKAWRHYTHSKHNNTVSHPKDMDLKSWHLQLLSLQYVPKARCHNLWDSLHPDTDLCYNPHNVNVTCTVHLKQWHHILFTWYMHFFVFNWDCMHTQFLWHKVNCI